MGSGGNLTGRSGGQENFEQGGQGDREVSFFYREVREIGRSLFFDREIGEIGRSFSFEQGVRRSGGTPFRECPEFRV
jgi:hypothetical protein